jgi:hypothetical protein
MGLIPRRCHFRPMGRRDGIVVYGDVKENSTDMLFFYLTFGFENRVQTRNIYKEGCAEIYQSGPLEINLSSEH